MILKVCGMKQGDNIRRIEQLGVDLIGFIFYAKSPRYVDTLPDYLPERAQRVGVFVNEAKETVCNYADLFSLDYIQLHGNESPDYCRSLSRNGLRIIKAFSIATTENVEKAKAYEGICDYYVFDTQTTGYGGSGKQFDWSLLNHYTGTTPFLLSGGIAPEDTASLTCFHHPQLAGYDLNSRFEVKPGLKNEALLEQFIREIKK